MGATTAIASQLAIVKYRQAQSIDASLKFYYAIEISSNRDRTTF
jgi:hypothetical protein